MKLRFYSVEQAKDFVNAIEKLDFDINLNDGSKMIDAKSLMGILNLDFNKSFDANCVTKNEYDVEKFAKIAKDIGVLE